MVRTSQPEYHQQDCGRLSIFARLSRLGDLLPSLSVIRFLLNWFKRENQAATGMLMHSTYSWLHYHDDLNPEREKDRFIFKNGDIVVTLSGELYINNTELWSMTVERENDEIEIVYSADGEELVAVNKQTSNCRIGGSRGIF